MSDNELLSSSKTLHQRFYFSNQTGGHMWLQSPDFMSVQFMIDEIIMNLFTYSKEQRTD